MFKKDGIVYYNQIRNDVLQLIPSDLEISSVLDVGCGDGVNLEFLKKERGAKFTTGIEINGCAAEKAKTRVDYVIHDSIENPLLDLANCRFNLILCMDVLEHLYDPWSVVKKLSAALIRDGVIIASVPNIQHWNVIRNLLLGKWEYTKAGFWDDTHIRFFTKSTITRLFQIPELRLVDIHCTMGPELHFINYFTLKILEGLFAYKYIIIARKV